MLVVAMVVHSSNVLGVGAARLINYISGIHLVVIVVFYNGNCMRLLIQTAKSLVCTVLETLS